MIPNTNAITESTMPAVAIPLFCGFLFFEIIPKIKLSIEQTNPQQKNDMIPRTNEATAKFFALLSSTS